jgi:hemolysin activation/secretion protein
MIFPYLRIFAAAFAMLWPCVSNAQLLEIPDIRDSTPLRGKSVYENMDVPPVRERNPNPEAGPRIWVREFKVQGIVERPDYGITKKGIDAYVENLRRLAMREQELIEYGYSLEDLAAIADLMVEIDAANNMEQVTEPDVQRLIWLVRDLKERRGLTLGQIDGIAEQLTIYYRKRGFFLTKVYIPAQEVRDGTVGLTVLEGKLGNVSVSGNERYNSKLIVKAFNILMYKPVNEKDIEQKLYLLNDYPGLDVYGYFKAGDQVGDTQLNIEVRNEKSWGAMLRYDNHGSELTGRHRFYAQAQWHNPTNNADDLLLGVLQTVDPENSTYGILKYRVPLFSEAFYAGVNFSQNQFVIGDPRATQGVESLGLSGETTIVDALFQYSFVRSRERNWVGSFLASDKKSNLDSEKFPTIDRELSDRVTTYALDLTYDRLTEKSRILHQLNGRVTYGQIQEGAKQDQEDTFSKFNYYYSFLTFARLPWTKLDTRLILKSTGQYTDAALPPVEQFSVGGPNVVRAFPVNQYSADSVFYAGADWIFSVPRFMNFKISENLRLANLLQPFIFVDYAYGELNPFGDVGNEHASFSGYGLGLQFNYKSGIAGNLQLAKPISSIYSNETVIEPEKDWRLVADFQYVF